MLMFALWLLLLIVVPIAELYLLAQVADGAGWGVSIALIILVSMIGAVLMKSQASGAVRRIIKTLGQGKLPSRELAETAIMIFASGLVLTPGFLTDVVGIALFLPPVRSVASAALIAKVVARTKLVATSKVRSASTRYGPTGSWPRPSDTIDVDDASSGGGPSTTHTSGDLDRPAANAPEPDI